MKIKVYKLRENAKLPVRAYPSDAGMDIFYSPPEGSDDVELYPGDSAILETGLKIEVPPDHMLQIMNKSSVASKKQLVVGACVVDNGYNGEVLVNLQNIGLSVRHVEPGQKLAQAVVIPIVTPDVEEIFEDKIYESKTSRDSGGFGSTGDF